jgi:stage IV sporulation protein FB
MGWEDRPYYRDRGASSNPLTALFSGSLKVFTLRGVRVRVHSALIVFVACELLLDWTKGYDWPNKLVSMAALLLVLLLHEWGHSLFARLAGGMTHEVLLWPLGGLSFPDTPHRPGPRFAAAFGGPFVSMAVCAVAAWGVWLTTAHDFVSFNPFHSPLPPLEITWQYAAFYFWWIFVASYFLLIVNLLPIFPLDGGRILQTFLWKLTDHQRSMALACSIGMGGSVGLGVLGLAKLDLLLILLAASLFFICYQERIIQSEMGPMEPWQSEDADYSSSLYRDPSTRRRRVSKRAVRIARKRARQEQAERLRLDTILAKVSATGIGSLTWRERRALRRATERRRKHDMEIKDLLQE